MKKSVRITISIIVLALLGLSISLNVYLGIAGGFIGQSDSLSGFIAPYGQVNTDWNTHENLHIANGETSREFYYSHNQTSPSTADHICDVHLNCYTDSSGMTRIKIDFNSDFDDSNDLASEFYLRDSAGNEIKLEATTHFSGWDTLDYSETYGGGAIWGGKHDGVYI